MPVVQDIIQAIIYGTLEGGLLMLGALSFGLIFSIVNVINFSHGDIMTLGAYLALLFSSSGLPFPVSILASFLATGLIGAVIARTFYKPIRDRGALTVFLTSIGIAVIIRGLLLWFWGPIPKAYDLPLLRSLRIGPFLIPPVQLAITSISVLIIAIFFAVLRYTRWGKALRAISNNRNLAQAFGIPVERYITTTWYLSSALAALGGIFLGVTVELDPRLGWEFLILIFASIILGGIGSLTGAIIGALAIGYSMNLSSLVASGYEIPVAFGVMILVLLIKPEGIMGGS